MYPPGHVAVGILLVRRMRQFNLRRAAVAALLLGTLTPDLIDKSLQWAAVYPWGRTWGHSLVGNLALAVLALSLWMCARAQTDVTATQNGQGVAQPPPPAITPAVPPPALPIDPSAAAERALVVPHPENTAAGVHQPAPTTTLAVTNPLGTTAALLGCLAVGQWSHLVADLWADLEQGAVGNGYLWSAWLAWPWLTSDDLPRRMSPWLPGHRWFTFSEALVVILTLRLGLAPRSRPLVDKCPAGDDSRSETVG
ncbi:MAG: hypothetical protein KGO50_07695 [Myxococcales bacterium]|nr:hypothetical protein [Myxococcales bacterium]